MCIYIYICSHIVLRVTPGSFSLRGSHCRRNAKARWHAAPGFEVIWVFACEVGAYLWLASDLSIFRPLYKQTSNRQPFQRRTESELNKPVTSPLGEKGDMKLTKMQAQRFPA